MPEQDPQPAAPASPPEQEGVFGSVKATPSPASAPSTSSSAPSPPPPPSPPARPKSGKGGGWLWLLLGLLALGAAVVLALDRQKWQQARDTALEWGEELTAVFAEMRTEMQPSPAVAPTPAPTPTPTPEATPAPAPAAATQAPASPATSATSATSANNAAMQKWIAATELKVRQLQADSQQSRQSLEALAQQQSGLRQSLEALAQQQSGLQQRIGTQSPYARQAALSLGLLQLSRASMRGAPFETERRTLAALLPGNGDVAALETTARQGVAGEAALLLQVPSLVDAIAASRQESADAGPWEWAKGWISGLVQVRRLDDTQDEGRDGALARMQHAARAGRLNDALAEAAQLRGADAALAADWMLAARQRLQLQARIASLGTAIAGIDAPR